MREDQWAYYTLASIFGIAVGFMVALSVASVIREDVETKTLTTYYNGRTYRLVPLEK